MDVKTEFMDVSQDFGDYGDIVGELLSGNDATAFQQLLVDGTDNILFDNGINQSSINQFQNINSPDSMTSGISNEYQQYDPRYSTSDSSVIDEGSPYSIGSSGSIDSGIRSADLSSPDSPLQSYDGTRNIAFPFVDTNNLNLQMPLMDIQNNLNLSNNSNLLIKQLQDNVIGNDASLTMRQLQDQLSFYKELTSKTLKEQLEKQQQQQQQQFLQQQLQALIILQQQQKLLQENNVSQPQVVPTQQLTQTLTQPLTQPAVTLATMPQEDLSVQKDSQIRKILLMTKSNIDKTRNKIQDTFQETKSKLKKLPNPNKQFGKRKLPQTETTNKPTKVQAKVEEQSFPSCANTTANSQNSALASLLLQPTAQESLFKPTPKLGIPIAPATVNQINNITKSDTTHIRRKSVSSKGCRKTRVEHVVIEKRYRMKITGSLNKLKDMLNCHSEKKSTKNAILQEAINEIEKLRKENHSLRKKVEKMKRLFEELRSIGIIPESQNVSVSSSESEASEPHVEQTDVLEVEPEIIQDHYASPSLRQSARDGTKVIACFGMFLFLFITPFNWMTSYATSRNTVTAYQSRHLLSVLDQDSSPKSFLWWNVVNIIGSLILLMIMFLRGNPKCVKNQKLILGFKGQLRRAQKKINKKDYEDAKSFLRIALFLVGNSCPKTLYGMWASFLWKCICHMLYQLGILTALESFGNAVLPTAISGRKKKAEREFSALLSVEAYKKLHEVALKDPSSTYLEAACYLMNAVHAAETSGDQELICTAYTTAVLHMRDKVKFFSYLLQYYFTSCAHHASLASKDDRPYPIDWIFESRGYDFFSNDKWDIRKHAAFDVPQLDTETELDEADLLQTVYAQFQDHLLTRALRRIVVPETHYPNEGKIELHQRAIGFLDRLSTGPASEQLDSVSLHYQSVYGWWRIAMKNMLNLMKHNKIEPSDLHMQEDLYEDMHDDRNRLVVLTKSVLSVHLAVLDLKAKSHTLTAQHVFIESDHLRWKLLEASQLLNDVINDGKISDNEELQELITILCCNLLINSSYMLWSIIKPVSGLTEQELSLLTRQNEVLRMFTYKYRELSLKVEEHDYEIEMVSGLCHQELSGVMKRSKYIRQARHQSNELNAFYLNSQNYPLKQDGFLR